MLEDVLNHFPWLASEFAGLAAWLWVLLPAIFIGGWMITRMLVALIMGVAARVVRRKNFFENYVANLSGPVALFATAVIFVGAQGFLPLEEGVEAKLSALNAAIFTFAVAWAMVRLTHTMFNTARDHFIAAGSYGAAATIPLMRKLSKATIVVLALIFLLQNWGFDVAAIIAALGVGGIALALASQKSFENLFGGVMISLDQPIRVGDFGKFGDFVGTVEDIGLRSTRIRTLGRTLVTIPNAEMASMRLETFAPRDKILLQTKLGLRYETTADQMRYIIVAIKELLLAHPKIDNDPARARFVAFSDYALEVEVFAYVKTSDWSEYLEVQEDLFLRIKDIVAEAGSDFAFPSQTMYFERGAGMDADRQKKTGAKVEAARKQGKLQWPNFTHKRMEEVTDTLTYPPKESAAANER